MDVSLLKYPKKSHRKVIKLPSESTELAELLGIVFGDGGINNPWQLVITLNSIADRGYVPHVKSLLEKLFGIEVVIRKRKDSNALVIISSSTNLVDFLVEKGAARGNKVRQQIDIPEWVLAKEDYVKYFVRGLVDTDGCLYIHKHTTKGIFYRNIGFCFSNRSRKLIHSVAQVMKRYSIDPHIAGHDSKIYLYGQKTVVDYLSTFGSSNPRIFQKYSEWRGA